MTIREITNPYIDTGKTENVRLYTVWEIKFLNEYLFSPESAVAQAVLKARDDGDIGDEPIGLVHWAQDMGTVFRYSLVPATPENPRGKLHAEDLDVDLIEKETGLDQNRILKVRSCLVDADFLSSKVMSKNKPIYPTES